MLADHEALKTSLAKNWEISSGIPAEMDALKQALTAKLSDLIQNDFEQLVKIMYRLDVDENKFHFAMSHKSLPEQADVLSSIVIERELQRLAFRQRYKQNDL